MEENTILCRCSDISLKEVRDLITNGYQTFEEIKRIKRAGMGPCQGRTCGQLIMQEIARMTGKDIKDVEFQTYRPPVLGIELNKIASGGGEND